MRAGYVDTGADTGERPRIGSALHLPLLFCEFEIVAIETCRLALAHDLITRIDRESNPPGSPPLK
jgi:hypothetical protein